MSTEHPGRSPNGESSAQGASMRRLPTLRAQTPKSGAHSWYRVHSRRTVVMCWWQKEVEFDIVDKCRLVGRQGAEEAMVKRKWFSAYKGPAGTSWRMATP